ncbi:unnamed protein product, partial [Amoebophrya sp. A25]
ANQATKKKAEISDRTPLYLEPMDPEEVVFSDSDSEFERHVIGKLMTGAPRRAPGCDVQRVLKAVSERDGASQLFLSPSPTTGARHLASPDRRGGVLTAGSLVQEAAGRILSVEPVAAAATAAGALVSRAFSVLLPGSTSSADGIMNAVEGTSTKTPVKSNSAEHEHHHNASRATVTTASTTAGRAKTTETSGRARTTDA